jgi:predicted O-methyltransferase YrrM
MPVAPPALTGDLETQYATLCCQPSDINEHLPVLRAYAAGLGHVTEFGMRKGISTTALIAARPRRLISYDIVEQPVEVQRLQQLAAEAGVDFEFRCGNVLRQRIEPTELLFIDTWHVYDQLIWELLLHSRRVSRFIIMHDTTSFGSVGERRGGDYRNRLRMGRKGLWPAVQHFLWLSRAWQLRERRTNNNGLSVLERRSSQARPSR